MRHFARLLVATVATVLAVPVVEERQSDLVFDYIVVGSGAGGGPLASRLARAGQSVLLIESGDDQGTNYNYTVPGYQAAVTQDPQIAWDIYVSDAISAVHLTWSLTSMLTRSITIKIRNGLSMIPNLCMILAMARSTQA